jgi:hypothetical protein
MAFFLFGKKKRRSRKPRKASKPPAALLRKCRKFKIKTTKKVGKSRVYRSASLLKKLLKKKMKKAKKAKKVHRKSKRSHRKYNRRGFSFGSSMFTNAGPANYGYNQPVVQTPGIMSQSSQMVTANSNPSRPMEMQLAPGELPVYGVGRPFFTETVPTQVPPQWDFLGQPDGSMFAVGSPIVGYRSPAFGRKSNRPTKRKNETLAHYKNRLRVYKKKKVMYKKIKKLRNASMDYDERESRIKNILNNPKYYY